MTDVNPNTETITIALQPQDNGKYLCQMSLSLSDFPQDHLQCYGQSQEHAIAIALEQLADDYRRIAEERQNIDSLTVERSDSGEPIAKHYHVILHYERIAEEESKFQAIHNTIMGNTVVENAKITVIEIAPDIPIEPLSRSWDELS
jgi:hypothetical protein